MSNKDLFKGAIAEAKSVREAAIANAKEALEETLTPHLKDMLATKLQEMEAAEIEEEVTEEVLEDEMAEAHCTDEDVDEVEINEEEEEASEEDNNDEAEEEEEAEDDSDNSEDEAEEEAPAEEETVAEVPFEDLKDEIRAIIASELEKIDLGDEAEGEEEIEITDVPEEPTQEEPAAEEEDNMFDLNELLREIEEGNYGKDVDEEQVEESIEEKAEEAEEDKMEEELKEALETIESLRNDLHEVNLLNSKLLYVNKLFKSNNLTESQKANVIASFDKAETVKEVKLVFETFSSNIKKESQKIVKEAKLANASRATGTTAKKPEIISESNSAVTRMQKLAGIIK